MPIPHLPSRWVLLRTTLAFSRTHWQRTLLLIFGIALGVSAVIAIDIAKSSVGKSFSISTDLLTGKATHRIVGSRFRIDQQIFADLKMKLGIETCAPVISDFIIVEAFGDKKMQLLGIDPYSETTIRNFSASVSPSSQDSFQNSRNLSILEPSKVMISAELAEQFHVEINSTLFLSFGQQRIPVKVAGLLNSSERWQNKAYRGIVLTDIATAQELLQMGSDITHIDLILGRRSGEDGDVDKDSAEAETIARQEKAIRSILPSGAALIRTAHRNTVIRSLSSSFETSLSAFSMLALFMAMFLIYNTVSFSVAQRRRLIGVLRSLGATRQGIFKMILLEIICYAVIGAVFGMGLGIVLGKGAVQAVCQTVSGIYFPLIVSQPHVTPAVLIKGMTAGIGSAVTASLLPALEATRYPPVTVIVRSDTEERIRRRMPLLSLLGVILSITSFVIFMIPHTGAGIDFAALFMTFTGAALLVPYLTVVSIRGAILPIKYLNARHPRTDAILSHSNSMGCIKTLQNVLGKRMRPTVLTLTAMKNIVRGLSRTTVLIASLTVVMAVYIGIGTMTASFRQSVVTWVDDNIGGDIHIRSADRRSLSLDPLFIRQALALPEVERASTYSIHRIFSRRSGEVRLFSYATDYSKREWVWTADGHETRFAKGGIYVSEIFARCHGIQRKSGRQVILSTLNGAQPFTVVGIFRDFMMGGGRVIVNRPTMKAFWGYDDITSIQLFLKPEALPDGVFEGGINESERAGGEDGIGHVMTKIRDLASRSSNRSPIEMRRGDSIKEGVLRVFDQTFLITTALQLLTAIVALTGIVNSVMALLLERVREIGILRACGAESGQVTRLLLMECGMCGLLSGLFAVPLGGYISWVLIDVINRRAFGWTYDLIFQGDVVIQAVLLALVSAWAAAIIPARQMGKRHIATALRME